MKEYKNMTCNELTERLNAMQWGISDCKQKADMARESGDEKGVQHQEIISSVLSEVALKIREQMKVKKCK
jgi:hypothetical protein